VTDDLYGLSEDEIGIVGSAVPSTGRKMLMLEDEMIHGGWPRWTSPPRIELETPVVPQAVAAAVWEEVSLWLGEELPRAWLTRLTERAEAVYASNERVRRRLRGPGNGGRDWLWAFTRHWLAALIRQHRPDLHARLPGSYSVGHPLPQKMSVPSRRAGFARQIADQNRPPYFAVSTT
jgi:hypothetical protein